jgi:hypothetical protein
VRLPPRDFAIGSTNESETFATDASPGDEGLALSLGSTPAPDGTVPPAGDSLDDPAIRRSADELLPFFEG